MIRLRLFGGVGLRDANGAEIPLTAPKRFGVLAYLALANSSGARPRDELMAMFWPDLDEARARAVLRQTLRLLRMDLGADVVKSRGAEVALSPSGTWCDALAFEELLDAGSEAEALELYAGPLLSGFHYPRASWAFEEWRDAEARRLQERAVRALWRLVDQDGDAGRTEGLLRRVLQISPYDEAAFRGLVRSLAGRGNRAEAVALYEAFADRLASELDVEPSPETKALAAAARSASPLPPGTQAPRPQARRAVAATRRTPTSASGSSPGPSGAGGGPGQPPARAPSPKESRRFSVARVLGGRLRRGAAVALLVLIGGFVAWRATVAPGSVGDGDAVTRLVVLPFAYRGDPQLAYLGGGVARLLSGNLDGVGPLRTVDSWAEEGEPDETAASLARRLQARLYVTGEVMEAGGRLRVSAALHDRTRGAEPEARAAVEGTADEVFALVDAVAATLLSQAATLEARLTRSAAATTTSLPALRAYLQGEDRLREGRYDEAIAAFEAATTRDTVFALAYYRLSVASEWAPRPDLMRLAAEAAVRHADRLPHRERSLLEASLAWHQGDAAEAERRYREILRMYPDDPEAWFHLGEVHFHYNPLRGRHIRESEAAWRRVLAADPGNLEARLHLARVLSAEGRLDELEAVVQVPAFGVATGDRRVLQLQALREVASGGRGARSRIARQLRRESDAFWVDVWYVMAFARNLEGTEPLLELLIDAGEPQELRALGYAMRAHVRVAQGRWRDARADLAAAERLDPATGLAYRGYLGALPFVPASTSELERLRSDLVLWDADAVPASADPRPAFTIHADVWPAIRHYLIGGVSVRLGDLAEAEGRARALVELAGEPIPTGPATGRIPGRHEAHQHARELERDLALGLLARIAWWQGRPQEALDLLEGLGMRTTFERAFLSPFHARALQRYMRGELLFELGREEDALRWFDATAQVSPYELAYLPFSHLRLAQAYERRGDAAVARDHFLKYRTLWTGADREWRDALEGELRRESAARR